VDKFKYLGNMISNDERDDQDVLREVRGLFTRTNILARKFKMCSVAVKQFCLNHFACVFYGMELWKFYTAGAINRLQSCYIRCMKYFWIFEKIQCD